MNYKNAAALGICLLLFLIACERPGAPDFSLEHKVQVPLTVEKEYRFLGGSEALIDTTNEDFSSLFTVGGDGLVSLSKSESFEFGDLDALPEISVEPVGVSSAVGELHLGSFSTGSSVVAGVSFQEVTGLDPAGVSDSTSIPDQENRRISSVSFTTDRFVSATIKSGSLLITVENLLGFNIDEFNIEVFSGGSSLGTVDFGEFSGLAYPGVKTGELPADGKRLEGLEFILTVSWWGKEMETDIPGPFLVTEIEGENLIASQIEAAVPLQDFSAGGTVPVDDTNFRFTDPSHHIELDTGGLLIHNVVNEIDLDIDKLQISFPTILKAPYTPSDSLVVTFEGDSKIAANCNCGDATDKNISLSGYRIYADGNTIDFNISGITQDDSRSIRTIHENDSFTASLELENIGIRRAVGVIVPRTVLINDDVTPNGLDKVDLFNDSEAEVISIDGLSTLSEQIDGLEFADPGLSMLYSSNLDVETTIYAAIAGKSAGGNVVYLSGRSGEYSVSSSFGELMANGDPISGDKLIKFRLSRPEGGNPVVEGIEGFNKNNTTVDEFMNNLPTEVRFIGLAGLNEHSGEGTVIDPIRFDPGINIDLPLHFSSATSTFSDTVDADLKDVPGNGDSQALTEATVTIGYINRLPFRLELSLIMLDEQFRPVTEIPLTHQDALIIRGAAVNNTTKYVETGREGELALTLNEEQLAVLNNTRHMSIRVSFNTTDQNEVKIRAEDSISLSVKLSVALKSDIN